MPFPHPHPFPPHFPLLLPQNKRRMMIHKIELQELFPELFQIGAPPFSQPQPQPHPVSQPQPHRSSPHPQFVAAKSLIKNPPNLIYTVLYVSQEKVLHMKKN